MPQRPIPVPQGVKPATPPPPPPKSPTIADAAGKAFKTESLAAPLDKQRFNIVRCPMCDGKHPNVELREFAKDMTPWTHWFLCPTTEDPVSIRCVMTGDNEVLEVDREVCRSLEVLMKARQYLVGMWWVEDGLCKYRRISESFPTGDFPQVCKDIREDLEKEAGPFPPDEMPVADAPKPIELFADAQRESLPIQLSELAPLPFNKDALLAHSGITSDEFKIQMQARATIAQNLPDEEWEKFWNEMIMPLLDEASISPDLELQEQLRKDSEGICGMEEGRKWVMSYAQ